MKRIAGCAFLLLFVSLTSCVIEPFDKPDKTTIAYSVTMDVTRRLTYITSLADLANCVEKWRSAPTQQERNEIEDLYFGSMKVREEGDIIHLYQYCKINTFGESLSKSAWEIHPEYTYEQEREPYKVSQVSSGKLQIERLNAPEENQIRLMIEAGSETTYNVTGEAGKTAFKIYSFYDQVSYTIDSPLIYPNRTEVFPYRSQGSPASGEMTIQVYKDHTLINKDEISVTFQPGGLEVSFRGFKKQYTSFY